MSMMTRTGLEVLLDDPPAVLAGKRIGLVMNQASVDRQLRLACDLIDERFPGQLTCLFSPQHGIWGEQQANMIESEDCVYERLGIPVFSLYSATRRPSADMLDRVDCVLVDLQDVGTRVYTFVWTLLEVLRACGEAGKPVVVLDRPNPLGGQVVEGPLLDPSFTSFVGGACIPLRHGCTLAELAALMNAEFDLRVELHTIAMQGWSREMWFQQTGLPWLWPSPNMPTTATACVYPGQVLLEGVNLSEGRGTTRPFEVVGAPFVDAELWLQALGTFELPGVRLLATRFQPTFDKWARQSCQGVDIQVTDPIHFRSVAMTVAMIATAAKLFPEFRWLDPPYEYETVKMPIDILFGNDQLRLTAEEFVRGNLQERELLGRLLDWDQSTWWNRIRRFQLY